METQTLPQPQDTSEPQINIKDIFLKRDEFDTEQKEDIEKSNKDILIEDNKVPDKKNSNEQKNLNKEEKEDSKNELQNENEKEEDEIKEKKESTRQKLEFEKLERRYKDVQKWANESHKKLTSYEKAVKEHVSNGILTDEEAQELLNYTKYEDLPPEDEPLLLKYGRIWQEGIERMREFVDDPKQEIDKYVHAFQQLLRDSSPDEVTEILESFADIEDSKAAVTKKMLKMGKDYYDEGFGEVYESGSIRNFKEKYSEKEREYIKRIDKLEKEVDKYKKKYEDYTEANYNIPSGGSDNYVDTEKYTTDVKKIFSMR